MKKCPYCFEEITGEEPKCPHCLQFIIDTPIEVSYKSFEKKKCILCGKKVLKEARFCKYCRRWLDSINDAADDLRDME